MIRISGKVESGKQESKKKNDKHIQNRGPRMNCFFRNEQIQSTKIILAHRRNSGLTEVHVFRISFRNKYHFSSISTRMSDFRKNRRTGSLLRACQPPPTAKFKFENWVLCDSRPTSPMKKEAKSSSFFWDPRYSRAPGSFEAEMKQL